MKTILHHKKFQVLSQIHEVLILSDFIKKLTGNQDMNYLV